MPVFVDEKRSDHLVIAVPGFSNKLNLSVSDFFDIAGLSKMTATIFRSSQNNDARWCLAGIRDIR